MKKILLLLTMCFIIISINGQNQSIEYYSVTQAIAGIKNITLIVKESDMSSNPSVNFLHGEVARYLESKGYSVKFNKYFEDNSTCQNAEGYFAFSCQQNLTRSGKWEYIYEDVIFYFTPKCSKNNKEFEINLGNFTVSTSFGSVFNKLQALQFLVR